MLTIEKILDKTYTPRDLWQTLERMTELERAIFAHRETTGRWATDADMALYIELDKLTKKAQ
jgi:hypothetical protein